MQPFLYESRNDTTYYDDDTNLDTRRQKLWTSSDQPVLHPANKQAAGLTLLGLGIGGTALFGNLKFGEKRGWDYIVEGIRHVEEYSPGKVFRTFQASQMLSGLETVSRQTRYFSPEMINEILKENIQTINGRQVNVNLAKQQWLEHVSRLTGKSTFDLSKEGFRFQEGKLLRGLGGSEVLLEYAGVIRSPIGTSTRFQEADARSLAGGPLPHQTATFSQKVQYIDAKGKLQEEVFMITGGHSRTQAAKRFISGYGTSLIERMNQLARSPSELPGIKEVFSRVPVLNKLGFHVEPSSGLKTLGKLTAKLGILAPLTYLAYQELDYHTRNASILDNTVFKEGITAGFATLWTKGQLAVSKTAEALGLHDYRESQEKMAPKSTELSKLAAFPLIGATTGLFSNYFSTVKMQSKYQYHGLDVSKATLATEAERAFVNERIYGAADDFIPEFAQKHFGSDLKTLNLIRQEADKRFRTPGVRIAKSIANLQSKEGFIGKAAKLFGKITPESLKWKSRALLGLALVAPFIPGALIPSERPEELEALYTGQKNVPIRKGRWWSLGRSPYEGNKIDRFQKHWYPRLLARAKDKAIWGEDEPSPLSKWFQKNFTYNLEERHYYDRPFPQTSPAFSDVPILGPLLSSTIGRIIKPPVEMHTSEWKREGPSGEIETILPPLKFGEKPPGPGELDRGVPVSPYDLKRTIGQQVENLKEAIGFPGFIMETVKGAATGNKGLFDQEVQLASSSDIYSPSRDYWDRELGDLFLSNELFRRLYPRPRSNIEKYNPIRNTMPEEWMPGPGDRSLDFLHGDPFSQIPLGEERLPGSKGYEALHPEVKGLDPKDYPLINRYEILADVAKYSSKFREAEAQMKAAAKNKQLTKEEAYRYQVVKDQLKEQRKGKEFTPYKYKERAMTPMEEILAAANEKNKIDTSDNSWFKDSLGSYWETLGHNAELSIENLTPLSPGHKFVHMRTAVEDYEKTQAYGTLRGFWEHPIRDFIGPTVSRAKHTISKHTGIGSDSVPAEVQKQRDLNEYFDILKYVKHTRLKKEAELSGDTEAIRENEQKRRETLFGINPYTNNYSQIFRALPRSERDYFTEFTKADMEERAQILNMVPENEQPLYMARWELKDNADMQKAVKKGLLSEKQVEQAKELQKQLYEDVNTEGLPKTEELWTEYLKTREQGESYPDWYRRTKLLPEKLKGMAIPGPDWVGFSSVNLEDVKLKIVEKAGENLPDYDLWPEQQRAVARKPIVEEATEELESSVTEDPEEVRRRINEILSINGIKSSNVSIVRSSGISESRVDLDVREDRTNSSKDLIRKQYNDE